MPIGSLANSAFGRARETAFRPRFRPPSRKSTDPRQWRLSRPATNIAQIGLTNPLFRFM